MTKKESAAGPIKKNTIVKRNVKNIKKATTIRRRNAAVQIKKIIHVLVTGASAD